MADNADTEVNLPPQNRPSEEKVGDILKRERITRRIAIETIARDLKLNVRYIKSIENSEYDDLPDDPYIRVYLRSMARYLMLDTESLLKKFYKEHGIEPEGPRAETVSRIEIVASKKDAPNLPWGVIIVVAVLLGTGIYVAGRMGLIGGFTPATDSGTAVADSTAASSADTIDSDVPLTPPEQDPPSVDTLIPAPSDKKRSAAKDTMSLRLRAIKDSVWVQVFADNVSWKSILYKNDSRTFTAADSFNVHVGENSRIEYFLNGKQLQTVKGLGVVVFKIGRGGVTPWTLQQWMTVFKNRI